MPPGVGEADRVFAFVPLADEPDITPLFDRIANLALPVCGPDGTMDFVDVAGPWRESLRRSPLGVLEPSDGTVVVPTPQSIIFVPGLAFTQDGWRLGRGKGYYDRYLARFPFVNAVGVCQSWRIVPLLPHDAYDRRLNQVLISRRAPGSR